MPRGALDDLWVPMTRFGEPARCESSRSKTWRRSGRPRLRMTPLCHLLSRQASIVIPTTKCACFLRYSKAVLGGLEDASGHLQLLSGKARLLDQARGSILQKAACHDGTRRCIGSLFGSRRFISRTQGIKKSNGKASIRLQPCTWKILRLVKFSLVSRLSG